MATAEVAPASRSFETEFALSINSPARAGCLPEGGSKSLSLQRKRHRREYRASDGSDFLQTDESRSVRLSESPPSDPTDNDALPAGFGGLDLLLSGIEEKTRLRAADPHKSTMARHASADTARNVPNSPSSSTSPTPMDSGFATPVEPVDSKLPPAHTTASRRRTSASNSRASRKAERSGSSDSADTSRANHVRRKTTSALATNGSFSTSSSSSSETIFGQVPEMQRPHMLLDGIRDQSAPASSLPLAQLSLPATATTPLATPWQSFAVVPALNGVEMTANASPMGPLPLALIPSPPAGPSVDLAGGVSRPLVSPIVPLLSSSMMYAVRAFLTGQLLPTVVTIFHGNVAQKSYGNEKRFLCPPPMAYVDGCLPQDNLVMTMHTVDDAGYRSQGDSKKATWPSATTDHTPVDDDNGKGAFKYLYVAQASKARRVHLTLQLTVPSSSGPGAAFLSKPIGVISKPSKMASKTRCTSLTIYSGSLITLFNRVNSQTVRTKYMSVENRQLCGKNSTWSPFQILVTGAGSSVGADISTSDQLCAGGSLAIHYGMHVVLRCVETNVYSSTLVVKRISKGSIATNATGPVAQMHKITFALANRENLFLCISGAPYAHGASPFLSFQPLPMGGSTELPKGSIPDEMVWTIVGVERATYRYLDLNDPFSSQISCLAQVYHTHLEDNMLQLHGARFQSDLVVCAGSQPLVSRTDSSEVITCLLPPPMSGSEFDRVAGQLGSGRSLYAAILLVSPRGTVNHTGYFLVSEGSHPSGPVVFRTLASA